MEIKKAIQERIAFIDQERAKLVALLDTYDTPIKTESPDISKSDKYKYIIRDLIKEHRAWHITDMEKEFHQRGADFNKGIVHQVLNNLRETGEVMAVKINGSNQKYFYMSPKAANGGSLKVKEDYLPIPREYIEAVEVM